MSNSTLLQLRIAALMLPCTLAVWRSRDVFLREFKNWQVIIIFLCFALLAKAVSLLWLTHLSTSARTAVNVP
jgi:hypothetical protein